MSHRRRKVHRGFMRRGRPRVSKVFVRKTVQRVIDSNSEFKFFDVTQNDTAVTVAGVVVPLISVGAGDAPNQRDGNVINLRSLQMRMLLENQNNTLSVIVRVLLVRVLRQDVEDLIVTGSELGLLSTATIPSLRNMFGVARNTYRVLMDKKVFLGSSSTTLGNVLNDEKLIKFYKKWKKPIKIKYASSSADSPRMNSLYLVFLSTIATNIVSFQTRVRFTDS